MTVYLLQGGFSYSGQRCTAVKVVLAMEEIADELVKKVNEGVKDLSVGMPEVCHPPYACPVYPSHDIPNMNCWLHAQALHGQFAENSCFLRI